MTFDPTKTPGSFAGPPPGAPHEVTDGTVPTDVTIVSRDGQRISTAAMARANEQDLPAYAPKPMSDEQAAAYLGKSVDEIRTARAALNAPVEPAATTLVPTIVLTDAEPVPVAPPAVTATPSRRRIGGVPAAPVPVAPESAVTTAASDVSHAPAADAQVAPPAHSSPSSLAEAARQVHPAASANRPSVDEPYYPARSDSDSPSRGIPSATLDKGKQITGGFGDVGEAQYFPMTGLELQAVALKLLDEQRARIQNDLRFSLALTYPRVRLRSVIEVECYASDGSFLVEKIMVPPHEKTPIDVARRHGDRCCFAVIDERIEMDDDGNSVTPPNVMRQEIGAEIPRKRAVPLPGGVGRLLVDVES